MIIHARPWYVQLCSAIPSPLLSCSFYCIILLTALFLSSCYWQPIPLTSSVSSSWATNASFATVITAALSSSIATPLPAVIRLADRCWCDVSSSRLFEPFDIARWERASVEQLKEEIERDAACAEQLLSGVSEPSSLDDLNSSPPATNDREAVVESQLTSPKPSSTEAPAEENSAPQIPPVPPSLNGPPVVPSMDLPLLRRKYDFRPYGFSLILDFGWSREE